MGALIASSFYSSNSSCILHMKISYCISHQLTSSPGHETSGYDSTITLHMHTWVAKNISHLDSLLSNNLEQALLGTGVESFNLRLGRDKKVINI